MKHSKKESDLIEFRSDLKGYIKNLLNNENELKSISQRSYRHLNGFSKIVLKELPNNEKIRLHVWNSSIEDNRETDIHDHRWSFTSIPIFGEFIENEYLETPIISKDYGDIMYKHICFPRGENQCLQVKSKEKVKLNLVKSNTRYANDIYTCKSGDLHTFFPTQEDAATIVHTYDVVNSGAKIFKKEPLTEDEIIINVPNITLSQLKKDLQLVLKMS